MSQVFEEPNIPMKHSTVSQPIFQQQAVKKSVKFQA